VLADMFICIAVFLAFLENFLECKLHIPVEILTILTAFFSHFFALYQASKPKH